jgi:GNAT superfamily N-acetyltransferase
MRYRPLAAHEVQAASHLAAQVFCEDVAPLFPPEGVAAFLQFLAPDELWKRLHHEHFILVAEEDHRLVGLIEMRDHNHIELLFVERAHQRQGIGRDLVELALRICRRHDPALAEVSVNATPNAVAVYQKLGFHPLAPEQCIDGMRFVPMVRDLAQGPAQVAP